MMEHEQVVASLIRSFGAARGVAVTTASRLLTGNGDTIARLDRGGALTSARAAAIARRARELWPATAERRALIAAGAALHKIERAERAADEARARVLNTPPEAA